MTVANLLDEWLEDMRGDASHRTWLNRGGFVGLHLKPKLGTKRLGTLTAHDIRRLTRRKLRQGWASSSIRRTHELLNQAMKYAVRSKYIHPNPSDDTTTPKASYRTMDVLTPEQVKRLLDTVRGHRWEYAVVSGAVCGLRIGEAHSFCVTKTLTCEQAPCKSAAPSGAIRSTHRKLRAVDLPWNSHRLPQKHYGSTRIRTASLKRDGAFPLKTATHSTGKFWSWS